MRGNIETKKGGQKKKHNVKIEHLLVYKLLRCAISKIYPVGIVFFKFSATALCETQKKISFKHF